MIRIYLSTKDSLVPCLEDYFCENSLCNWGVSKTSDALPPELFGYFDSAEEALCALSELKKAFPEIDAEPKIEEIEDSDWQNKYKEFLTAWNFKNLHWVPVWMREQYKAPPLDKVLYFDAGLAFGTGDHPTTRLCAMAMMRYADECADVSQKSLIDAGCGSGILALSAKLLGFGDVFGFDRDTEAVRASIENAKYNNIAGVVFAHSGIENALEGRKADIILANIQADVLCIYAENLIKAVSDGGRLVLSGILAAENAEVKKYFDGLCADKFHPSKAEFMGDWSSLEFIGK